MMEKRKRIVDPDTVDMDKIRSFMKRMESNKTKLANRETPEEAPLREGVEAFKELHPGET